MLFTSFGFILLHANSGPFDNRSYMCPCLGVKKDLGAEFFIIKWCSFLVKAWIDWNL